MNPLTIQCKRLLSAADAAREKEGGCFGLVCSSPTTLPQTHGQAETLRIVVPIIK